jgi:hypothetical protein
MALSKIQSESLNLADNFAFTGTVTGAGSDAVVQVVTHRHGDMPQHNSSSWTELSSNYRISITPQYSNSKIFLTARITCNRGAITGNTLFLWSLRRSTNSGSTFTNLTNETDGNTGSRHGINGGVARAINGYDTNDMNPIGFTAVDTPGTTGTVIYTPYVKQESSGTGTMYWGHSSGNTANWGFHHWYTITAMEIKV